MIRVLIYLVIVFAVAIGAAWLADRPGEVVLHWQGYEIRTSLLLAAAGVLVVMAVIGIVWALLRAVVRAPRSFGSYLGRRRRDRGYGALSRGIIAVGAGDARTARKAAEESRTLLGSEPLVLLLAAQAAQLGGDGAKAREAFEALAARPDTRLLGLHGLFVEAQRQDLHEAARHFADEAAAATPRVGWAGTALFEYAARDGDWAVALKALDANVQAGLVDPAELPKVRAALLAARAMELESGDPDKARTLVLDALRLDPGLAPAAVLAARLYARNADVRRASKVLETAWKVEPQPDIADAYAMARPGDSVLDRMKRVRRLAEIRANHPEGSMAVARAAIDAGDWAAAREALEGFAKAPTERVCLLMAEIEEREHGDQGRVRAWLTRALSAPPDPTWVADGQVLERWQPVSPVTGRVGVTEWRIPPQGPASRILAAIEAGPLDQPIATLDPPPVAPMPLPQIEAARREPAEPSPAVLDVAEVEPLPPVIEERPVEPAVPPRAPAPEAAPPARTVDPLPPAPAAPVQAEPPDAPAAAAPPVAAAPPAKPAATAVVPLTTPRVVPAEVEGLPPAVEEVYVPRPPDDPGPLPPDPEDEVARRRFRLF
jgi:HemY protein